MQLVCCNHYLLLLGKQRNGLADMLVVHRAQEIIGAKTVLGQVLPEGGPLSLSGRNAKLSHTPQFFRKMSIYQLYFTTTKHIDLKTRPSDGTSVHQ